MELLFGSQDPDKLFSYSTRQQVNVQNSVLGATKIVLQASILAYIVFGIFIHAQGYLEFEYAAGGIATHVRGDALVVSSGKPGQRYFSAEDMTYPGMENGYVFVATRQKVTRQRRGICEDLSMPCKANSDCSTAAGGRCAKSGFCFEPSWCSAGGLQDEPELYEIDSGNLQIWVKSSIQFVRSSIFKVYSTEDEHPFPEAGYNLFTLRDLLMRVEPVPIHFEEVTKLGASIEVQFVWDCSMASDVCKPQVKARRIDTRLDRESFGFSFSYPETISDDERVLNEMTGIRIMIRSVGTGRQVSLVELITKASTAGTTLYLVPMIADLLMLQAFKSARKYFARKYEISPDFSEFMEKLEEKQAQERLLPGKFDEEDQAVAEREAAWHAKLHEED